MPRSKLPSLNSIKDGSFEPNRKNAISLGDDSVLSTDSKPIKIGDKSSILELSEDSLIIRGAIEFDTLLRGILNSPNERMAFTARTGEYRWYSTNNDEDYVRMYVLGGNCLLQAVDASGGTQADISLDAGNDIILDAETGVFSFQKAGDLDDLCTLTVGDSGFTTIATADSDGTAAHLGLDIDGDIVLDSASGNITAKDNGGNYTPSSDYHVATKKYVDDTIDLNAGAAALNDLSDVTYSSGDLTISSLDKIVTTGALNIRCGATLTLDSATPRITLAQTGTSFGKFDAGKLYLKEEGSAGTDAAAFGQIWVKDDAPNNLYFTDDTGQDIAITNNGSLNAPKAKTYLDWYYYFANLGSNDTFYVSLHHDEFGVTSSLNSNISDYNDTTAEDMWRLLRYAGKRIPYTGDVTKFMVFVESTGASADSDVEVGVWVANKPTLDSELASTTNMTIDNLGYITFDFSSVSRFLHKELTSFNATSVNQGDFMFITVKKTTGTDGTSFNIHSTVTMDID